MLKIMLDRRRTVAPNSPLSKTSSFFLSSENVIKPEGKESRPWLNTARERRRVSPSSVWTANMKSEMQGLGCHASVLTSNQSSIALKPD